MPKIEEVRNVVGTLGKQKAQGENVIFSEHAMMNERLRRVFARNGEREFSLSGMCLCMCMCACGACQVRYKTFYCWSINVYSQ